MTGPTRITIEIVSCSGCDHHARREIAPEVYDHRCRHVESRETFAAPSSGAFLGSGGEHVQVPGWCPQLKGA